MSNDSQVVTVDNVLEAIDALFNNSNNSVKENASNWLCEFQKSVYAWQISDQLLYLKRDLNSCYFGAQTIRIKIQCHFGELPIESHESLRNSLLDHVAKLVDGTEHAVATQLCLALADVVCHMVQWKTAFPDIMQRFTTDNRGWPYLVDVLKFIPEEIISRHLRLGQNRRNDMLDECDAHKLLVLRLLEECLKQTTDYRLVARLLNCLASWLDNTDVIKETDVVNSPLLDAIFAVLVQCGAPEVSYEAAAQSLVALFAVCQNIYMYSQLASKLQAATYTLLPTFQSCAAVVKQPATVTATNGASGEMNSAVAERCMSSLAKVFNEMTISLLPAIVKRRSSEGVADMGGEGLGDLRTLDCLLVCLELGSREIATICFEAVQRLAEQTAKYQGPALQLGPYFTRLVVAVARRCHHTQEDLDSGGDDLRRFREDVFDLMQDVQCVLGPEVIFVEMISHINHLLQSSGGSPQLSVLYESEACLFILSTVAKRVSPLDPESHIEALVRGLLLPYVPPAPAFIQEVGFQLYGELAHWANHHWELRSQIIGQMSEAVCSARGIQMLAGGQREALAAALSSLGSLCSVGRDSLLNNHWENLIAVASALPQLPVVLISNSVEFFEGLARTLLPSRLDRTNAASGPVSQAVIGVKLNQVLSVPVDCLIGLMDGNVTIEGNHTLSDPCVWLDYIAAVFRSLGCLHARRSRGSSSTGGSPTIGSPPMSNQKEEGGLSELEPYVGVVQSRVWPVVSRVLDHYQERSRVLERACRVVRFIVRCLTVHLIDSLPPIAQKIVEAYCRCQQSCFLYIGGILVDEFGDLPNCRLGLVQMFEAMCPPTIANLSGPNLVENPNTVEDLFRLCDRLVEHCPRDFLARLTIPLDQLALLATRGLSLTDEQANMAVTRFLTDVFVYARDEPELVASQEVNSTSQGDTCVVRQRVLAWLLLPQQQESAMSGGAQLVEAIVQASCLRLDSSRYEEMADILHRCRELVPPDKFLIWLGGAVASLPLLRADGLVHASEKQIEDFKQAVCRSVDVTPMIGALDNFAPLFR